MQAIHVEGTFFEQIKKDLFYAIVALFRTPAENIFYRAMHFSAFARSWDRMSSNAQSWDRMSSVRLSVRL